MPAVTIGLFLVHRFTACWMISGKPKAVVEVQFLFGWLNSQPFAAVQILKVKRFNMTTGTTVYGMTQVATKTGSTGSYGIFCKQWPVTNLEKQAHRVHIMPISSLALPILILPIQFPLWYFDYKDDPPQETL